MIDKKAQQATQRITPLQLIEVNKLSITEKKLSTYDLLNYVIAKDNNAILATGDKRLKIFSEDNRVEVIRTLKIIKLLEYNKIISTKEAVISCKLLKENKYTRIPPDRLYITKINGLPLSAAMDL